MAKTELLVVIKVDGNIETDRDADKLLDELLNAEDDDRIITYALEHRLVYDGTDIIYATGVSN